LKTLAEDREFKMSQSAPATPVKTDNWNPAKGWIIFFAVAAAGLALEECRRNSGTPTNTSIVQPADNTPKAPYSFWGCRS